MGMSKQAKQANQQNQTEQQRFGKEVTDYQNRLNPALAGAQQRADTSYNDIYGGYKNVLNRNRNTSGPFKSSAMPYFQEFAKTGGISPENQTRMRGNGVFDEFAKTGGLSEADRGNIRAQGTAAIPGFFDSLSAELGRQNEASGGTNPGYNSQTAMLARDKSRQSSDAALAAELGITNQVNQGREWGAQGVSDSEGRLVDATQRGRLAGITGMEGADEFGANYDLQRNAQDTGFDLSALQGMGNLRGQMPGEVGNYEDLLSKALFGGAAGRRGLMQDYMQYNPNQSWAQRNAPWIQAIAGAGGTALSGFAKPQASTGAGTGGNWWSRLDPDTLAALGAGGGY